MIKLLLLCLVGFATAQSYVRNMLYEINRAREYVGLPALCLSISLTRQAQDYANLQASRRQGGHYVDGYDPEERALGYRIMAENLFEGFGAAGCGSSRFAIGELMRDAPHRDNILAPEFTHVGIGRGTSFRQGRPYYYWVQIFVRSSKPCGWAPRLLLPRVPRILPRILPRLSRVNLPPPRIPRLPNLLPLAPRSLPPVLRDLPNSLLPPERQIEVKHTVREPYPGGGEEHMEEVKKVYRDPTPPPADNTPNDDYYDPYYDYYDPPMY